MCMLFLRGFLEGSIDVQEEQCIVTAEQQIPCKHAKSRQQAPLALIVPDHHYLSFQLATPTVKYSNSISLYHAFVSGSCPTISTRIYTNIGTALVAINPHKYVPTNSDSVMQQYAAEYRGRRCYPRISSSWQTMRTTICVELHKIGLFS
jgi:hypothetical protein